MPSTDQTPEQQEYDILTKVIESFKVDLEKCNIQIEVTKKEIATRQLTGVGSNPQTEMAMAMMDGQVKMITACIALAKEKAFASFEKVHGPTAEKR